jgi:hypothetical protein
MKSSAMHPVGPQTGSYKDFLPLHFGTDHWLSGHAKKMGIIAGSCVAIALAGLLTRGSFTVTDHADPVASVLEVAPMAQPMEPARPLLNKTAQKTLPGEQKVAPIQTREIRFARDQVAVYANLLDQLQTRMNDEPDVDHLTRMRAAITSLSEELEQSRAALSTYESRRDPFAREDLKGQIFSLQETGQKAVSVFIDADNFPAGGELLQVFNVSRTGQ